MVTTRYAVRSVGRNLRRAALSIIGIGIGCALALFMESLNRGRDELFARMAASSGIGHVRIVPAEWRERRDPRLRLQNWQADLAATRTVAAVSVVAARARAQVLLAMGSHVVPVEMAGVDPTVELRAFPLAQKLRTGRYLRAGEHGTVVVGKAVADRLVAELDDDVLATAVGRGGAIESLMLRIVGIVETGSEDFDASICQVLMEDVGRLSGLAGPGELVLMLDDWRQADEVRARLAPLIHGGDEVLTWGEVAPEFKGHIEQDSRTSRFVSYIILLVVLLGVASAQLAAVLERRREFAVLAAIGMRARTMVGIVLQEALALGLAGGALGLAIGVPVVWRFATAGLDLRRFMGANYTFMGIFFEPVLYGSFGPWILVYVLTVAIGATMLASLYPAWFAARTDPAVALRVAQ